MNTDLARLRHEDPDRFARELIDVQLAADRAQKIEITQDGPDDLPRRIAYLAADSDELGLIMPMLLGDNEPTPAEMIAVAGVAAREQFGPPFLVAFLAEAYMREYPEGTAKADIPRRRGALTEAFAKGAEGISECISITLMHRRLDGTLRTLSVQQPFHYAKGEVVFGEPMWVDSLEEGATGTGAIPETMASLFGSEQN